MSRKMVKESFHKGLGKDRLKKFILHREKEEKKQKIAANFAAIEKEKMFRQSFCASTKEIEMPALRAKQSGSERRGFRAKNPNNEKGPSHTTETLVRVTGLEPAQPCDH